MTGKYALVLPFFWALCCLTPPEPVRAEIHTITTTARETFGDDRAMEDARIIATVKARRQVLSQAVAYIAPLTIVKTQGVQKSDFPVLAAAVFEPDITSQKNFIEGDGFVYEVSARINVNTATLEARATRLLADKGLLDQYHTILKKEAELLSRVNALKKQPPGPSTDPSQAAVPGGQKQNPVVSLAALYWYNRAVDLVNHEALGAGITEKAMQCLQKAIQLDPEFSPAFSWLGRVYASQGDYARAIEHLRQALKIDQKILGKNHPDLADNYNRLGLALHRNSQYDQAIDAYLQAWKIQVAVLGESHPDVAAIYNNLGESWRIKGDLDKAIEYYEKDLEISLAALGRQHPGVATTYNNLAYAFFEKGDHTKAIEYFQKALDICRSNLGEDHPQAKAIKDNIDFIQTGQQN